MDGKVVGHVAFSPIKINGHDCQWFVLGPVGVLSDHQRRGIGQKLIREGLKAIRSLSAEGCVLVGDPAYYSRFGFTHNPALVLEGVPPRILCAFRWLSRSLTAAFRTTRHSR
jgi:putative acetyltransferase